jgi:hypothetical protein
MSQSDSYRHVRNFFSILERENRMPQPLPEKYDEHLQCATELVTYLVNHVPSRYVTEDGAEIAHIIYSAYEEELRAGQCSKCCHDSTIRQLILTTAYMSLSSPPS